MKSKSKNGMQAQQIQADLGGRGWSPPPKIKQSQVDIQIPYWSGQRPAVLRREMIAMSGIPERELTELVGRISLPKFGQGVYSADAWHRFMSTAAQRSAKAIGRDGKFSVDDMTPRDRKDWEMALKLRTERESKEGSLVSKEDVQHEIASLFIVLSRALDRVPKEVAGALPRGQRTKLEKVVRDKISRIRRELARTIEHGDFLSDAEAGAKNNKRS